MPWVLVRKGCSCWGAPLWLTCPSAGVGFKMQAQWARDLEEFKEFIQKWGWWGRARRNAGQM